MLEQAAKRWSAVQLGLALLACLVVPGFSWLDGSGALAWTMYAHSSSFRLRIATFDAHGKMRSLAPSSLAARSEQDLRTALGGAESFRHARQGRILRGRLPQLAELACRISGGALVVLTLEERRDLDAPLLSSALRHKCQSGQVP